MAELEAANASLQRLSAEQQRRIDDATAALRRKVSELEEAQRRVEQAQQQREQFISEVVHELRGPMTGLYGYAHLLGEPALAPERQERARNMVLASVRRLNRLLEDLTDAAQLQAGRFRVQLAEADLAEVVREQVEQAAAQLGPESRHRLLLEAPTSLALLCDRDRVGQVLGNLMNNALKYTPGGDLHVSLCRDGSSAIVSVADSGPGIPEESLEAVFKPHVRLRREEAADKTAPRGSGLGLYISRGIVEAHGGRMWAERNGAGGTTFTFTLPLAPGDDGNSLE
jgi:signal transduction histidine kinase